MLKRYIRNPMGNAINRGWVLIKILRDTPYILMKKRLKFTLLELIWTCCNSWFFISLFSFLLLDGAGILWYCKRDWWTFRLFDFNKWLRFFVILQFSVLMVVWCSTWSTVPFMLFRNLFEFFCSLQIYKGTYFIVNMKCVIPHQTVDIFVLSD